VYWMSIAHILKGVLKKSRKNVLVFYEQGKRKGRNSFAKWTRVATPKELGGWGLK
jgi:hypothetical protein